MAPPGTYSATDGPVSGLYTPNGPQLAQHKPTKALKTEASSTPAARGHGVETEKGALPEALESWRANLRGNNEVLVTPRPDSWWTGLCPQATPGFCVEEGTLTSLPLPVRSLAQPNV